MTMLTKIKLVLAVATVVGAGSFASAAGFDGDNNPVPGVHVAVPADMSGAFASTRGPAAAIRQTVNRPMGLGIERDGDGNRIPGGK
jgi:hypothetical protein